LAAGTAAGASIKATVAVGLEREESIMVIVLRLVEGFGASRRGMQRSID
jgi:hypothetical protein